MFFVKMRRQNKYQTAAHLWKVFCGLKKAYIVLITSRWGSVTGHATGSWFKTCDVRCLWILKRIWIDESIQSLRIWLVHVGTISCWHYALGVPVWDSMSHDPRRHLSLERTISDEWNPKWLRQKDWNLARSSDPWKLLWFLELLFFITWTLRGFLVYKLLLNVVQVSFRLHFVCIFISLISSHFGHDRTKYIESHVTFGQRSIVSCEPK